MPTRTAAPAALPAFAGFSAAGCQFLLDLARHNERDWFQRHKTVYQDEVLAPARALVQSLSEELGRRKLPLRGDPARAVFRVHRDVRFSRDKTPYKPFVSAVLTRDGERSTPGLLYFQVEPGQSFAAAGFWQPDKTLLARWRGVLADRPQTFQKVLDQLAAEGLTLADGDGLKRMPRGFEDYAASPLAAHFRLGSFVVRQPLDDAALRGPGLVADIAAFAQQAAPLLRFGWKLVDPE